MSYFCPAVRLTEALTFFLSECCVQLLISRALLTHRRIPSSEIVANLYAAVTGASTWPVHLTEKVFAPTLAFCLLTQWLGLYVASFLLVGGFMILVGRIAAWKSILTALVFSVAMFVTFQIAFDVIMPKGPLEAAFGY